MKIGTSEDGEVNIKFYARQFYIKKRIEATVKVAQHLRHLLHTAWQTNFPKDVRCRSLSSSLFNGW